MTEELTSFGFGNALKSVLTKRNFLVESYEPADPIYFGNLILIMSNDDLRLRFVRDRHDLFVDFGPKSGFEWFGMRYITKLVDPALFHQDGIRPKLGPEEATIYLLDKQWLRTIEFFKEGNIANTRLSVKTIEENEVDCFLRDRKKSKK